MDCSASVGAGVPDAATVNAIATNEVAAYDVPLVNEGAIELAEYPVQATSSIVIRAVEAELVITKTKSPSTFTVAAV